MSIKSYSTMHSTMHSAPSSAALNQCHQFQIALSSKQVLSRQAILGWVPSIERSNSVRPLTILKQMEMMKRAMTHTAMMNQAAMRIWLLHHHHLLIIDDVTRVLLLATHSLWVISAVFCHWFKAIQSILHASVLADLIHSKMNMRKRPLTHPAQRMHHNLPYSLRLILWYLTSLHQPWSSHQLLMQCKCKSRMNLNKWCV